MKAKDPKNPTLEELQASLKVQHPRDEHVYFGNVSGRACYLLRPDLSDIRISDIVEVLARVPRWGGHTTHFYSVAQHSVLVSKLCPPELAMVGLLHDATEAYLGDIISPLKRLLPEYKRIEKLWAEEIGLVMGLGSALADLPDEVKRADLLALEVERHDLLERRENWYWWGLEDRPTDLPKIQCVDKDYAWLLMYERFLELGGKWGA